MNDKMWLTTEEAAEYAGLHTETLTRLSRSKKIKHGRAGREYRFKSEWLDQYIEAHGWSK